MNRWKWGWLFISILALFIVFFRATSDELLSDSDTILILNGIKARGAPFSWFITDWPLGNHFYRPVVSLLFEADLAIHGSNAAGYGLSNALLAALSTITLFWLLKELTDRLPLSVVAAGLFGVWHLTEKNSFLAWFSYPIVAFALLALLLPGRSRFPALFALCGGLALLSELACFAPFRGGIIDWIPGRTASTMTLFCLIAMASFTRSIRVSQRPSHAVPGPLDPPATRGTSEFQPGMTGPWVWLTLGSVVLALGCYEQAIMLPAVLIAVALAMRLQGFTIRWTPHVGFWILLGLYAVARIQFVPTDVSGYQAQQFRSSLATFLTICNYLFPSAWNVIDLARSLELGLGTVLLTQWAAALAIVSNIGLDWGLYARVRTGLSRSDRTLIAALLFGFSASVLSFLPMAFLKPFDTYNHYHYWAMAIRSVYAAALLIITIEWLICALSPRAIQAPKRLAPAPGSLPHP